MTLHSRTAFRVGHWTDDENRTGCTVILFDRLVPAVVDVRGGAPGTRETDLLASDRLVGRADAFLLTGGSANGLVAADGVMRYLRERGRGFETAAGPVPIVPAAVIFDLAVGNATWPDADAGHAACDAAQPLEQSATGRIGAGTGATYRKLWPNREPLTGGFGWSTVRTAESVAIHALAVVNAVGDVVNNDWVDGRPALLGEVQELEERSATTLMSVIVDGTADQRTLRRIAASAHDAMARMIVPCHTLWDGDLVFAAQTGETAELAPPDALRLTIAAELAVEQAVRSAVGPSRN
jgi:L-aminopeptidase/D-esterase-like protein